MAQDIYLVNTDTRERVQFQTVPRTLEIDPQTVLHAIKSSGANISKQHFTGAEPIISFEMSWYSEVDDRSDVISKCRKLVSWSMNDGFSKSIPKLLFLWGNSLFDGQEFILVSAKYSLQDFNGERDGFPIHARQEITLVQVSDHNPSHDDISRVSTPIY